MKNFNLLALLIFVVMIVFSSCNDEKKTVKIVNAQVETNDSLNDAKQNAIVNFYKNASGTATTSVFHYTCPKGCEGGAASAENCSNCGTTLVHNAAFHNNKSNVDQPFSNSLNSTPAAAATTATNSSGVYHYICENGCIGGSASAGDCPTCGSALAHNAAYHNN